MAKPTTPRTAVTLESDHPLETDLRYEASADPLAGGTLRDLPIFTPEQVAAQITRSGFSWDVKATADGVLTYGFYSGPTTTGVYNNPHGAAEKYGYAPMTAAQQEGTREALAYWDDLIPLRFQEDAKGAGGWDMSFATTTTGPGQAWAYLPHGTNYGAQYQHIQGDVWINPGPVSGVQLLDGFYGMQTLTHEIGHALGLSHPGDYDAGDGVPLSYELADYYQDSRQYSVMSYWDAYETGAQHIDWSLMRFAYSTTPGVHDILAIQKLYGVDTTTRTGDTTYGFNWSSDLDNRTAFQIAENKIAPIFTIWDAGGEDTLDLSGYDTPSFIDLNPGSFSSAGGIEEFLTLDEINANNAAAGLPARSALLYEIYNNGVEGINGGESWIEIAGVTSPLMKDNISIAYGAVIENAKGGGGTDTIVGNSADNVLTGNGGNDVFVLSANGGNDTVADFEGGPGAGDRIDLSSVAGLTFATLTISDVGGDAVIALGTGSVTLTGVSAASLDADDFIFA
ncbi:MAG: M10 family metallopeptidase C-terminal domain-containing protein [Phenylobacterium sp.]|uniref:M10 family metallopeptidase C-terminal domain-containing protein n=1 Tax=Phenylobacterium sp. TaxID=1871053 RepID=UPI00273575E2|nr:M10 family metallopeptidase C-terminal domain-containing protein [Phenylobacterium sp.]MDP3748800.1 M10 family metallopeptidase C-terminal domain-containing protein [Phenylobacterium sp.]